MDMRIFVDTDDDVRLARRSNFIYLTKNKIVYRDIKERGRKIDTIIKRYHQFVKSCFVEFIKPVYYKLYIKLNSLTFIFYLSRLDQWLM